mmetsp:Transcript_15099/g.41993  ORF Transcript_15099/g.41993 Transcript_15099/m.41993 type:complete len:202 (+) Transcript_15099:669-1274(+)
MANPLVEASELVAQVSSTSLSETTLILRPPPESSCAWESIRRAPETPASWSLRLRRASAFCFMTVLISASCSGVMAIHGAYSTPLAFRKLEARFILEISTSANFSTSSSRLMPSTSTSTSTSSSTVAAAGAAGAGSVASEEDSSDAKKGAFMLRATSMRGCWIAARGFPAGAKAVAPCTRSATVKSLFIFTSIVFDMNKIL